MQGLPRMDLLASSCFHYVAFENSSHESPKYIYNNFPRAFQITNPKDLLMSMEALQHALNYMCEEHSVVLTAPA